MFSVIFEVEPKGEQFNGYLAIGKMLRPELEKIEGFIDNIRYASLTRTGCLLSLSGWADEKALVRWRIQATHHNAQEKGRNEILLDYHLRVGQITRDTRVPKGLEVSEQRLDETAVGNATAITLIDASKAPDLVKASAAIEVAQWLGLDVNAQGLVGWDVFEAVLTPGDVILLMSWVSKAHAQRFEEAAALPEAMRLRRVRVIRDYGKYDRREAPQFYPDATPKVSPNPG